MNLEGKGELTVDKYRPILEVDVVEITTDRGDKGYLVTRAGGKTEYFGYKEFHEKFEKVENQSEGL